VGINEDAAKRVEETQASEALIRERHAAADQKQWAEQAMCHLLATHFCEWATRNRLRETYKAWFTTKGWVLVDRGEVGGGGDRYHVRVVVTNNGEFELFNANYETFRTAVVELVAQTGYSWSYDD
jgi:hypothetical protein